MKTGDSGRRRAQAFCPECGSPIYATSEGDAAKIYSIRVGTSRQRHDLVPKAQIWCRSAQPWLGDLAMIGKAETE